MGFTAAGGLVALVYSFTNFLRYLSSKQWRSVITQGIVWASGLGGVFLFSVTQWSADVSLGGRSLQSLSSGSKIVVGLLFSSLASVFTDVKKAIDGSDSASVPPLASSPAPEATDPEAPQQDVPGV